MESSTNIKKLINALAPASKWSVYRTSGVELRQPRVYLLTVWAIDCSVQCSHSGVAFWEQVLDGLRVRLRVGMKIIMGTSSSLRRPCAAPRAGVSKSPRTFSLNKKEEEFCFDVGSPK